MNDDEKKTTLSDGSAITPNHRDIDPETGLQRGYVILSDEERAKGFVEPVRLSYKHLLCGAVTTMGQRIAETYAREPSFYDGTFCAFCKTHFPLDQFHWEGTTQVVGSRGQNTT